MTHKKVGGQGKAGNEYCIQPAGASLIKDNSILILKAVKELVLHVRRTMAERYHAMQCRVFDCVEWARQNERIVYCNQKIDKREAFPQYEFEYAAFYVHGDKRILGIMGTCSVLFAVCLSKAP